ncbi:MAG: SUMF1/EgtB/PvdO family nonheme iron enzyme [Kiritimatiellae bacterium]|nr:SUMF1/EgtB/PvdO family nonheme iron enzyme [Kiritimatiellia bacterium]
MRAGGIACLAILFAGACGRESEPESPGFVSIPGGSAVLGSRETPDHPPREVRMTAFALAETEITVAQYVQFLRDTGGDPPEGSSLFQRASDGWRARRAVENYPVTGIRREDAEAYARWLGRRIGAAVRLPSEEEWEYAARGGLPGARWPWGWGPPENRAHFDAPAPAPVRTGPVNPYGLWGMAGNVFEWCAGEGPQPGTIPARGGAWPERDPNLLRVFHRAGFARDYAGADVGFRVLRENPRLP